MAPQQRKGSTFTLAIDALGDTGSIIRSTSEAGATTRSYFIDSFAAVDANVSISPGSVRLGQEATATIQVFNTSVSQNLTGVEASITIPPGATVARTSLACTTVAGSLHCPLPNVALHNPTSSEFLATVRVAFSWTVQQDDVFVRATVTASGMPSGFDEDDVFVDFVQAFAFVNCSSCATSTLTLDVENDSNTTAATGLVYRFTLPLATRYVSSPTLSCVASGDLVVTCTAPDLAPNADRAGGRRLLAEAYGARRDRDVRHQLTPTPMGQGGMLPLSPVPPG
jgi:hypothetical protein